MEKHRGKLSGLPYQLCRPPRPGRAPARWRWLWRRTWPVRHAVAGPLTRVFGSDPRPLVVAVLLLGSLLWVAFGVLGIGHG